jgi:hypothetical protein
VGTLWAKTIEDASISSGTQGSALGSAYLASFGAAVERVQVTTRFSGEAAGTVVPWEHGRLVGITTTAFAWDNEKFRIKNVTMRSKPMPGGAGVCVIEWDIDLGSPLVSVGESLGRQWNNTEVLPRQHAPDVTEANARAA